MHPWWAEEASLKNITILLIPIFWTECVISECVISVCVISVCVLYQCVLYQCVLYQCVLYQSVLYQCVLYQCVLYQCVCYISVCYISVCYISVCYISVCYIRVCYISVCYMDEMVLKHSVHAKCSPSIPAVEHLVGKVNNLETTTSMSNKLRYTISAHSIQLRRERELCSLLHLSQIHVCSWIIHCFNTSDITAKQPTPYSHFCCYFSFFVWQCGIIHVSSE